jgi:hypothetical protein
MSWAIPIKRFVLAVRPDAQTKRIRYLLGLGSQAERERIESEYFENEAAFQAMLATEDDLVDAYARGELTTEERQRFETHFLTSVHGRDRVQFARAFADVVSDASPLPTLTSFQWWRAEVRPVTIAAMIVLIAVATWLVIERRRTINKLRDLRAEQMQVSNEREIPPGKRTNLFGETTQPERSRGGSGRRRQRVSQSPIATATDNSHEVESIGRPRPGFTNVEISIESHRSIVAALPLDGRTVVGLLALPPRITARFSLQPRSMHKDVTLISVPSNAHSVAFRLDLETVGRYSEYCVVIERVGHGLVKGVISRAQSTRPDHKSVETEEILESYLPLGDYNLFLTGMDANGSFVRVAEYSFRVIKN